MEFSPFHYMQWAKNHSIGARFNLAESGLTPPPAEVLKLPDGAVPLEDLSRDLLAEVRDLVSAHCKVPLESVLITMGTSHALYLAMAVLLSQGDKVLVEAPTYEALKNLPTLFGAKVSSLPRRMENKFEPSEYDLGNGLSQKPRLVILSNPHNPSGCCLKDSTILQVAREQKSHGGWVLVDEVYKEYLDGEAGTPSTRLDEGILSVGSLTKAYGLGHVRIGWLLAPTSIIRKADLFNDYITVLVPAPSLWIAREALRGIERLRARARAVQKRNLPILHEWMDSREDVEWVPPDGGIIGFVRLKGVKDSLGFCKRLREQYDTQVVPGDFFGMPGHIRIGVGTEEKKVREGLHRLSLALDETGKKPVHREEEGKGQRGIPWER